MKTALEILIEARALIDTPDKWVQEAYASEKPGRIGAGFGGGSSLFPSDEKATCFCSMGAVSRVCRLEKSPYAGGSNTRKALIALELAIPNDPVWIIKDIGTPSIARYNDALGRRHSEIMAMFDKAIESLKSEQP